MFLLATPAGVRESSPFNRLVCPTAPKLPIGIIRAFAQLSNLFCARSHHKERVNDADVRCVVRELLRSERALVAEGMRRK